MSNKLLAQAAKSTDPVQVAKLIARTGGWVCGGAARDIFVGDQPTDIDIFVPKDQANVWYTALRQAGFKQNRRRFVNASVVLDVVPTDKTSALDIVKDFDIDVCQWYLNKAGNPVALNDLVFNATKARIATPNDNDKFGTSNKRLAKLIKRGWKVQAIDVWEDLTAPQDPNAQLHKQKFNLKDKVEVDTPQGKYTMDRGDHKVTVETRYGKVDAWVDDEFPLYPPDDKVTVPQIKKKVEDWLKANVPSTTTVEESVAKAEEECPTCKRMKDKGQKCWWCGADPSAKFTSWARKEANRAVRWYFANNPIPVIKMASTTDVTHTSDTWANFITEAILSFNLGMSHAERGGKRASKSEELIKLAGHVRKMVGEDAFRIIAMLVAAQSVRRPIDYWGQASTIYMEATSNLQDQQKLFESSKQLYGLAKTTGVDPKMASDIANLAADLQNKASAATAYSPGQPQVNIQGTVDA